MSAEAERVKVAAKLAGVELAPWQEWVASHLFCGGRFQLAHTRNGPVWICSCSTFLPAKEKA